MRPSATSLCGLKLLVVPEQILLLTASATRSSFAVQLVLQKALVQLLVPEQILLPTALATRCSSSRFRTRKAAVTFDLPCVCVCVCVCVRARACVFEYVGF
jgi:hypothetical protein